MTQEILDCIKQKAIKIAPDYPDIADVNWREQLYAIDSAYEGTCLANEDCHSLIDVLRIKLGMTREELVDFWIKLRDGL